MKTLEDSKDGKTRWIQLRVPITEGKNTRSATSSSKATRSSTPRRFARSSRSRQGDLQPEEIRKGLEKAQEVYGPVAISSSPAYPDLQPRDEPRNGDGGAPATAPVRPRRRGDPAGRRRKNGTPLVDVTMRLEEGKQYFVNRITFAGNTTTRDNVIRREMRLVEAGCSTRWR